MVTSRLICTTKSEIMQKRMPTRKPMSMVQYWVNTGKQPYSNDCGIKKYFNTESESSLAEKCLRQIGNPSHSCNYSTQEKLPEITNYKYLKVICSSNNSVDTAAYILSNNNTTKKDDTKTIVKGLKFLNKEMLNFNAYASKRISQRIQEQSCISSSSNQVNYKSNKNTVNPKINQKQSISSQESLNNFDLNKSNENNFSENPVIIDTQEEIILFNNSSSMNKNFKNTIYNERILQENLTLRELNNCQSSMSSESDTSIIKNKICGQEQCNDFQYNFILNSDMKNDRCRLLKRKKLYHSTESPVEFTPVSDTSFHQEKSKLLLGKYEHPALETPKLQSKPRYFIKYQRIKLKKKKNRHLLQSLMSSKDVKKRRSKLSNKEIMKGSNSAIEPEYKETGNITANTNFKNISDSNKLKNIKFYNKYLAAQSFQDGINYLIDEKFKLKPVTVTLYKLPCMHKQFVQNIVLQQSKSLCDQESIKTEARHTVENNISTKLNTYSRNEDKLNLVDHILQYSIKNSENNFEISMKNKNLIRNEKTLSTIMTQNDNMYVKKTSINNNGNSLKISTENSEIKSPSKYILISSDDSDENCNIDRKLSHIKIRKNSSKLNCKRKHSNTTEVKILKNKGTTSITDNKEILRSNVNKRILIASSEEINGHSPEKQTKMVKSFTDLVIKNKRNRYTYNNDEFSHNPVTYEHKKKNYQIHISLFNEKQSLSSLTKSVQSQDENKFELKGIFQESNNNNYSNTSMQMCNVKNNCSHYKESLLEDTSKAIRTKLSQKINQHIECNIINKAENSSKNSSDEDIITPIKSKRNSSLNNSSDNNNHIHTKNSDQHTLKCFNNRHVKKKNEILVKNKKILKITNEKQRDNNNKNEDKKKKKISKRKSFQFWESSDEECIIPLKIESTNDRYMEVSSAL